MKSKGLLACGILSAVVYVGTIVLGGMLRPDYSHLSEPISELTAAGVPNKDLMDVLFVIYNLLVVAFGTGVLLKAARDASGKVSGMLAGFFIVCMGICGVLLQFFFPQDPGGAQAAVTTTGTLHIVFAGLAALFSMLAVLCAALWFRKQPELKGYVIYSLVTLVVIFVSGGAGAAAATNGFSLFGLVERITIGALIQWLFVISLKLSSNKNWDVSEADTARTFSTPAHR